MVLFDQGDDMWCEKCFAELEKQTKDFPPTATGKEIPVSDLIARLQAPVQPVAKPELSKQEQVIDLHQQIEALCQNLIRKIEQKNEGLILNHEHFGLYENTLIEKYEPIFAQMNKLITNKKLDYTLYLKRQLSKNADRI